MLRHVLFLLFVSVTLQAENVDPTRFQAMEWRNIGPFRGGRSNASTGVPLQPGVFYFGGVGGGVWKTTDSGVTWTNITDGFFEHVLRRRHRCR